MWPFKKKNDYKLYRVVWKYDSTSPMSHAEFVSATNIADAWARIRKSHGSASIHCESIEEIQ